MNSEDINIEFVRDTLQKRMRERNGTEEVRGAVLIPLVAVAGRLEVVFEVRALHLKRQPGEVCLPGGRRERGEQPRETAIRETCEELALAPSQVSVLADLGKIDGPGGMPLWVFTGMVDNYAGTFDPDEVDSTFTVPLSYFLENEPQVYRGELAIALPDDFPWELIPQGRDYPWRNRVHEIPFYLETRPLIWGFTARVMKCYSSLLNG